MIDIPSTDALLGLPGRAGVDRPPVFANFGMGRDSTALVIECLRRGLVPDVVSTADTWGEREATYEHLFAFDEWLYRQGVLGAPTVWARPAGYEHTGLPERHELKVVTLVRSDGMYVSLEDNCRRKNMLPSLAYGGRSCSDKYKVRPQHKWAKAWDPCRRWWGLDARNRRTAFPRDFPWGEFPVAVRLIGYDAGESHRSDVRADDFYRYLYPLREWALHRPDCERINRAAGFPDVTKSACFYCPASKKAEVLELARRDPHLAARALAMEDAARAAGNLKTVKGLGRNWSWRELIEAQPAEVRDPPIGLAETMGCVCLGEVRDDGTGSDERPLDDGTGLV